MMRINSVIWPMVETVKNANDVKVGDHPFSAKVSPQRPGMGVLGANFKPT